MVAEYIKKEGINQTQLAERLGVSKGYISQIMNGNFNYTLKKMIELSLAVNKAPAFEFRELDKYIQDDHQKRFEMQYNPFFNVTGKQKTIPVSSGDTGNSSNLKQAVVTFVFNAA
jgi:transcriptional regulator with XRE-family HTH domain